ncbi:MAG: phosphopantothenoylcysteine decarboxylase, partial [Caldilineaceae bacterium]|nr:phosphopantothenoylcysteine decarboxylase [Caldilineaceae bacterium]
TAGGTREAVDPVRFLTNRSSGKQGLALAQAALDVGADVTLITTSDLPAPVGVRRIDVESAQQMLDAVLANVSDAQLLFMAAAVADFRPAQVADQKIKKRSGIPTLALAANPDILATVAQQRQNFP